MVAPTVRPSSGLMPGAPLMPVALGIVVLCNQVGAQSGPGLYHIERPRLAIDLSLRHEAEARRGPFVTARNDAYVLSEGFDIESTGWLYDPALVGFTIALSPQWQQTQDKPDGLATQSTRSLFLGYAVDLSLLKQSPYSVDLFAKKQRTTFNSTLASFSESTGESYGATLTLKYEVLPTTLAIVHAKNELSGFYESNEVRDEARVSMRHERKSNDTYLSASLVALDRNAAGLARKTKSAFAGLQNRAKLTADGKLRLNSSLSFNSSTSDALNSSSLMWTENLDWRHTRRFSTNYSFNHSRSETDRAVNSRSSLAAGLSHSLYENLVTTASASVNHGSGGERSYGVNGNLAYERRIPWGVIYASAGQDYRVNRRSVGNVLQEVLDESHVLRNGDLAILRNRNLTLASVVVTSADRSIVYALGTDYTLDTIGSSVVITRTNFGAITSGQTVLVSYRYLTNPAFDDRTRGRSNSIGVYLWSALRVTYRYSHAGQEFLAGTPPDLLSSHTSHSAEVDLDLDWSHTRWLYENADSNTGLSFRKWRFDESLRFRPSPGSFVGASLSYGETRFKEGGNLDRYAGARADLQWLISGSSKVRASGFYNASKGISTHTVDKGASLSWEWNYGVWTADASVQVLRQSEQVSQQSRDRSTAMLTLRRSLF